MRKFTLFIALLISAQCLLAQKIIKNTDPHIHYMGRINNTAKSAEFTWSGTSATINFNGSGVSAVLQDEKGLNFYNVVVDGQVVKVIHPDSTKRTYELVAGLPVKDHQLMLFKRTEWCMGKTWFYRFVLNKKGDVLAAPVPKARRIEYYGNSITCGYAIIDSSGKDRGTGPYEDNYQSYSAITARHFNAEYSCITRSGIGIMISWHPEIMPEIYDLRDATDPQSKWDFSKYVPQLVVVNLFQNDSWLVNRPEHEQFKKRFGTLPPTPDKIIAAYSNFIKQIRAKYPDAQIICALGCMDATKEGSPWPGYIEKAVAGLNDKKIYTCFFPYKNAKGHPNVAEHQAMAKQLITFIDQHIKW